MKLNNTIYNRICDLNRAYESNPKTVSKDSMYKALTEVETLMKTEIETDRSIRVQRTEKAKKMLSDAGYNTNPIGYMYLAEGIAIAAEKYAFKLEKDIYPVISKLHGEVSYKSIEFGMGFVLKQYAAKYGLEKPQTAKAIISQYSKELREEERRNASKLIPG